MRTCQYVRGPVYMRCRCACTHLLSLRLLCFLCSLTESLHSRGSSLAKRFDTPPYRAFVVTVDVQQPTGKPSVQQVWVNCLVLYPYRAIQSFDENQAWMFMTYITCSVRCLSTCLLMISTAWFPSHRHVAACCLSRHVVAMSAACLLDQPAQ